MRRYLSFQDIISVIFISALFAQVSWWVLFSTNGARNLLRPEIVHSMELGEKVTIASLPATLILPIMTYMPFWLVTFFLIRIFKNIEKENNRIRF